MDRFAICLAAAVSFLSAPAQAQSLPECDFGFEIDTQTSAFTTEYLIDGETFEGVVVDGEFKKGLWLSINRASRDVKELARHIGRLQTCLATPDGGPGRLVRDGKTIEIPSTYVANCTAALLPGNLLLTNHHCFFADKLARVGYEVILEVRVDFNYSSRDDTGSVKTYRVLSTPVAMNKDLDVLVLRVLGDPNKDLGGHVPMRMAPVIEPLQRLLVIHHPNGDPQQFSAGTCQVHWRQQDIGPESTPLRHTCETMGGSSGSLLFDARTFDVVALHNQGGLAKTGDSYNGGHKIAAIEAAMRLGFELADKAPPQQTGSREVEASLALTDAMLASGRPAQIEALRELIAKYGTTEVARRATGILAQLEQAEEEARRLAAAEAEVEAKRLAELQAERKQLAELQAERDRLAEAEAELRRLAEEERRLKAEARRLAEAEAEAKRLAEAEAEARRLAEARAEAELRRLAEEAERAEADRRAEAEQLAEAARRAEAERLAEEKRRAGAEGASVETLEVLQAEVGQQLNSTLAELAEKQGDSVEHQEMIADVREDLEAVRAEAGRLEKSLDLARSLGSSAVEPLEKAVEERQLEELEALATLAALEARHELLQIRVAEIRAVAAELQAELVALQTAIEEAQATTLNSALEEECNLLAVAALSSDACGDWTAYGNACTSIDYHRTVLQDTPQRCVAGTTREEPPLAERMAADADVQDCDRLAGHPEHPDRRAGLMKAAGVAFDAMDAEPALAACTTALKAFPEHPRLSAFRGRAYEKMESYYLALKYYQRAAEDGDALALHNLGHLYENGSGVTRSASEAIRYYEAAAEAGMPSGWTAIGMMYDLSRGGVSEDRREALKWYRRAAEAGDAKGQYRLARFYQYGIAVNESTSTALSWYLKAARQGDRDAEAKAGYMYLMGIGTPVRDDEALKWYRRAADKGDKYAMNGIGYMNEKGRGVPASYDQAAIWYQRSVDAGHSTAMTNLGQLYEFGRGVPVNSARAADLYIASLKAGREWALERAKDDWTDATARALQGKLARLGHYDGPIDGEIGTGSLAAMRALLP